MIKFSIFNTLIEHHSQRNDMFSLGQKMFFFKFFLYTYYIDLENEIKLYSPGLLESKTQAFTLQKSKLNVKLRRLSVTHELPIQK